MSYVVNRILLRPCRSSRGSGYVPTESSERSLAVVEPKIPGKEENGSEMEY